ncbi:MAG: efflux RND transporter permease subunit [Gammaproteobacteria bacterium]
MSLTSSAIKQNRVTATVVVLLLVAGMLAFLSLPKAQDPGFIIRTAVITTMLAGASPERMEQLVTDKIEKKAQEMPQVDNITSDTRTGISIIQVSFKESYKQMRPIFDELRRKVDDVVGELPADIQGPIVNDEFGDVFGSVYSLSGDGFSNAELKDIADEIRDQLLKEPDIAKVSIHGSQTEVIFVEYNNARLTELGLTPQSLSAVLSDANILSTGGSVVSGRERIVLEPTGNIESVEALRRTVIKVPDGSLIYLGDIVSIFRGYVDPADSLTRVNGQPALAIAVSLRDGGDILKLGERLDQIMPGIQNRFPYGIILNKIWFQADLVTKSVDDFANNLLQAIGIVILVMIGFLGLRTGMVVAVLIPSTMIITFFVMQLFGITINQISLAALIIALGLLVDNAIVMVESVLVKREAGMGAIEAAVQSGDELKMPLLISSLTTGAAFMPIALAESSVGEYTADIFYVVTIALLISWMLAMTIIPMLTTVLLKVKPKSSTKEDAQSGWGYRVYKSIITFALRARTLFFGAVVGVFVLAMYGFGFVPAQFIAPSEDPVLTAKLELPLGTTIETSESIVTAIDEFVRQNFVTDDESVPGVESWMTFVGEGGPRFTLSLDPPSNNPANSFMIANTTKGKDVPKVIAAIQDFLFENYPDMGNQLSRLENGPPVGYPIQIRLSGTEIDQLYTLATTVTDQLYRYPGVRAVKNTWGLQTKKLIVAVDQERALRSGVTSTDVAYSLRAGLTGIDLTQYREGDQLIPITLRTVASDRQDISKLDGLSVYAQNSGRPVPLKQVADIRLTFEPGIIERRDRERTITLKAQLVDGYTATEVNNELIPWIEQNSESWLPGYRYELGGEAESSGDANASIGAKLPLALMVIILLLVIQFNSVRRPIIILATIPLGLIGVSVGLLVANSSIGFFTLLGIIALSGIIINNAIVLIDRIKIEIDELGKPPEEAVVAACLQRFRPIMLTTATTVLGMMPLWWGGTAMFKPMAVTIIFGLLFATLLTLLVVPVMYAVFFRVPPPPKPVPPAKDQARPVEQEV